MLSNVGVCGVSECSRRPIFHFFIKENWICAETRHHAEPNINTLFTRNLPCDSDVRQWSHPLMIPLQANLNNGTRAQFECDVTWFCFCFGYVRSNARCSCCSIVCLRFQIVHMKQVDCEMSLKMWIITNKGNLVIYLGNCTHKSIKPQKNRKWGFS